MTLEQIEAAVIGAIGRAYDAGYKAGIDDTLALRDQELRDLVALAVAGKQH